jgi:ankyrin repeat protein
MNMIRRRMSAAVVAGFSTAVFGLPQPRNDDGAVRDDSGTRDDDSGAHDDENDCARVCQSLMVAISTNKPYEVAQVLRDSKKKNLSDEFCRNSIGQTPLILAADQGNVKILAALKDEGYPLVTSATDKHGLSPLSYAAWKGHPAAAALLLAEGADPCPFDMFGVAPIHKAAGKWSRYRSVR